MTVKKTYLAVFIFLFFLNCTQSDSKKNKNYTSLLNQKSSSKVTIQLTNAFTIKADSLLIGKIDSPVIIHEKTGNMIFYDSILNQIIITNLTGELKTHFGRKGSGPKEFRHITSFGINQDTIYVMDASLDLIKLFDFKGNLIEEYDAFLKDKLWARSNRIYFNKGSLYVGIQQAEYSSSNNHWESKIIAEYDLKGNLINLFGDYDPSLTKTSRLYKNGNIAFDPENEIMFTTHRTSPFINAYDLNTEQKIARFSAESDFFKISNEEAQINDSREIKNQKILAMSSVRDHFTTDDYFIFYFYNFTQDYWDTRNRENLIYYIQIFDKQSFEYLGETSLPYELLGLDRAGNLMLIEDENPDNFKIGSYEIITE